MRELALHLMDIAENSVAAQAKNIHLEVEVDSADDRLWMCVRDDGRGMDADLVQRVVDPFVTSRTTRKVGLGIPLLKAAAEACNGFLEIQSQPGVGTDLQVQFQLSHIDRMPLGDIVATMVSLLIARPQIHWIFRYQVDGVEFLFDDAPVKEILGDVPLTEPDILAYLRDTIESGVREVQKLEVL